MNHVDKIHQALRAVSERNGLECVDNTTPLDSLIDKEEEEVTTLVTSCAGLMH